mgnify:CR=1 FL=1
MRLLLSSTFLEKLELLKLVITLLRDDDGKVGVDELGCEVFADNKTKKTKYQNLESEMKTRQHAVCFRGLVVKYVILCFSQEKMPSF